MNLRHKHEERRKRQMRKMEERKDERVGKKGKAD